MAKTRIAVEVDCLKQDKEKIVENIQLLRKELEDIEEDLTELSKMWDGTAKQAFTQQALADQKEMKELCDLIYEISGCVAYAEQQYRKCETQVGEAVMKMQW